MSLDTFVAGRYSSTYNAIDIGITDEGYELQFENKAEMIERSDAYGDTIMDAVYRGGNCYLQTLSKAYKAGSTTPFWPFGALGTIAATAAPIARLWSSMAQAIVLTAAANTPAAAAPATLTIAKGLLAPNYNASLLFNSKLRQVPIRFIALPQDSLGTVTHFSTT